MLVPRQHFRLVYQCMPRLQHPPDHVVITATWKCRTEVQRDVEAPEFQHGLSMNREVAAYAHTDGPSDHRFSQDTALAMGVTGKTYRFVAMREASIRFEELLSLCFEAQRLYPASAYRDSVRPAKYTADHRQPLWRRDDVVIDECNDVTTGLLQGAVSGEVESWHRFSNVASPGKLLSY